MPISNQKLLQVVKLNVGGQSYCSTYGTLKQSPVLKELMDDEKKILMGPDKDEMFIDRSGYQFGYILDYLRGNTPNLQDDDDIGDLYTEAKYYQLHKFVEIIHAFYSSRRVVTYNLLDLEEVSKLCVENAGASDVQMFPKSMQIIGVMNVREATHWKCPGHAINCCHAGCTYNKSVDTSNCPVKKKLMVAFK